MKSPRTMKDLAVDLLELFRSPQPSRSDARPVGTVDFSPTPIERAVMAALGSPRLLATAALAIGLSLSTLPAAAQAPATDQRESVLAGDLLFWTQDSGAGSRIRFKRVAGNLFPRGGAESSGAEAVRSADPAYVPGDQRSPAIAGGLMVWSELRPGAADYDLYVQRLGAAGFTVGGPQLLIERPGDQIHPGLIATDAGEYLLVWSENGTDGKDIYGQRMSIALRTRGAAFAIAAGPGNAEEPIIVADPTDEQRYLVLWTDDRKGNKDIYGARLSRSGLPRTSPAAPGAPLTADFAVIETPANESAPAAVIAESRLTARDPRLQDSRSLVLWTVEDAVTGPDIHAMRLRSNGFTSGKAFVIAGGAGTQTEASVAVDSEGDWLVTWSASAPAAAPDMPPSLDLYGVRVNLNGLVERQVRRLVVD